MHHQIKLPRFGDTTQSVLIIEWLCDVGSYVELGTPLITVETDKVTVEIPSPVAGMLVEQLVSAQDEVDVGVPLCIVEA